MDEKIAEFFEVPDVARPYIHYFLHEDEISAILIMGKKICKPEELCVLLKDAAKDPEALAASAYSRAVFNKAVAEDGTICYQAANFYTRMAYFAQYEPEVWKTVPEAQRRAIDEWYLDAYAGSVKPRLEAALAGRGMIENAYFASLDEMLDVIDKLPADPYVVPCNCKSVALNCEKPREVCISTNYKINSQWDRGHGKHLTKKEAKELVIYANHHGLMQSFEDGMDICNCCGCCCYPCRIAAKIGAQGIWPRRQYDIFWDGSKCIGCGKCVSICNFGAFQRSGSKVVFNGKDCRGCTICSSNCPAGAISIKKIQKQGVATEKC